MVLMRGTQVEIYSSGVKSGYIRCFQRRIVCFKRLSSAVNAISCLSDESVILKLFDGVCIGLVSVLQQAHLRMGNAFKA